MNYITEEIDYTGCHPVIAELLRNNKSVKCIVKNIENEGDEDCGEYKRIIIVYNKNFYIDSCGVHWTCATPIPRIRRIKKASEIIAECERRHYKIRVYDRSICWASDNQTVYPYMLIDCGKTESETKYTWPDWAYEEVEG